MCVCSDCGDYTLFPWPSSCVTDCIVRAAAHVDEVVQEINKYKRSLSFIFTSAMQLVRLLSKLRICVVEGRLGREPSAPPPL